MKIAIISDTHDNTVAVSWIIDYLNDQDIQLAFHAGDIISPGILRRFEKHYKGMLHYVFGNNDGELSMLTQQAVKTRKLVCHNREMDMVLDSQKIFMNHYSFVSESVASTGKYDICIGGHDHTFRTKKIKGGLFINPGHTVLPDKYSFEETEMSFAMLDINTMKVEKIEVPTAS